VYPREYPIAARQSFRYDASQDEAIFTERVRFHTVKSWGGTKFAVMPPVAALAMQQGMPIGTSAKLVDLGVVTEFGPLLGVPGAEEVQWTLKGLGKYFAAPPAVTEHGKAPPELVAFRDMVPELTTLLADFLKDESAALVRRVESNQPTWYASFSEAILGAEHNMNHPSDAFQVFMARAKILGARPGQLEKWIDVPYVELGDLYYLGKLAETIRAYLGRKNFLKASSAPELSS